MDFCAICLESLWEQGSWTESTTHMLCHECSAASYLWERCTESRRGRNAKLQRLILDLHPWELWKYISTVENTTPSCGAFVVAARAKEDKWVTSLLSLATMPKEWRTSSPCKFWLWKAIAGKKSSTSGSKAYNESTGIGRYNVSNHGNGRKGWTRYIEGTLLENLPHLYWTELVVSSKRFFWENIYTQTWVTDI